MDKSIRRRELERHYCDMRQHQMNAELQLIAEMNEALLENLSMVFEPRELVRWLYSSNMSLWFKRPIDCLSESTPGITDEILALAQGDRRALAAGEYCDSHD